MGTQVLSLRQTTAASGGGSITNMPLVATVPGQTQFNIFTMPTGLHLLIVNGVEYFNGSDYHIITVGSNIRVEWINPNFSLGPTDDIVFRKF